MIGARSLVLVALGAVAAPAGAQVIAEKPAPPFPDPARFSRGFYAEGGIGALVFVGPPGVGIARYAAPGPEFHLRLGYDVTRWLGLQVHGGGSSFAVTTPPPFDHQTLQIYTGAVEARAQVQIRRVGLYLAAGGGVAYLSNDLLAIVGVTDGRRLSAVVAGGVGIDLHTLSRHFSVGLAGDYLWFAQWKQSHAVAASTYLRYTR